MKATHLFILLALLALAGAGFAAPSITSYLITIQGIGTTGDATVYISPNASIGIQDGVQFNITANETVNWTISFSFKSDWAKENSATNIVRPQNCSFWNGTLNQCSGPIQADGSYVVNVTMNASGVLAYNDSRIVVIDTKLPELGGAASNATTLKSTDSLQVNVSVSDTNRNNTAVFVNSVAMSSAGSLFQVNTTPAALGCTSEGNCTLRFNATDLAGNYNDTLTLNITVDNLPNVTLVSPANGSAQNTSSFDFVFSFTNDNDIQNTQCRLVVDGNTIDEAPNATTLVSGVNYKIAKSFTSEGVHSWFVYCNETGVGQSNATPARIVVYDTVRPEITLNSPANGSVITDFVNFSWTATDAIDTMLACDVVVDGTSIATGVNSANSTATNITTSSLSQGSHSWSVRCRDEPPNQNSSNTFFFTFDSAAPSVTLVSPSASAPIGNRTNGTLSISYRYIEARPANVTIELVNSTGHVFNSTVITNITLAGGTGINRTDTITIPHNATEGIYNITLTIFDVSGGNSSTTAAAAFVDNTAPVPAISISDDTLTQDDVQSATCSATDNLGGNITVKITDSGDSAGRTGVNSTSKNVTTSSTGTKTITCNATDVSGNSAITTKSYTVSAASSSGSSGGGGGEGGTSITLVTNTWDRLAAGVVNKWTGIQLTSGKITQVDVEVFRDSTFGKLTIKEISRPSAITSEPGTSYQYFDITATNIDPSNIKSARIYFQVLKSWLDANGFSSADIALYRWTGSSWQKLNTREEASTATIKKYSAVSPGFSTFAIFGVKPAGPEEGAAENETEEEAAANETAQQEELLANVTANATGNQTGAPFAFPELPWAWIGGGIAAVAAAAAAFKFLKGRRHPSGPRRIIVRKI